MSSRKKELLLLSATIIGTLFLCVVVLRAYAPQLLGIPNDLQMVQTSIEIPPFFENIFARADNDKKAFIIPDPTLKRAKPMFPDMGHIGPNDILGFRNRAVPTSADLVIIGDSQTYGNNALMDNNWPHMLGEQLLIKNKFLTRYDMAVGGWGAIEYFEAFKIALNLKPKVILIAFYTGNDSLETFRLAYANDKWMDWRLNDQLSSSDAPQINYSELESLLTHSIPQAPARSLHQSQCSSWHKTQTALHQMHECW